MDTNEIKKLIALMEDHSLIELTVELKDKKITLKKGSDMEAIKHFTSLPAQPSVKASSASTSADVSSAGDKNREDGLKHIVSPMVGTFYSASSPDSSPYVKRNQEVMSEDVVCIIEAMKVMNEIKAELRGIVVDVLVENGDPVEFGQPLFTVKSI